MRVLAGVLAVLALFVFFGWLSATNYHHARLHDAAQRYTIERKDHEPLEVEVHTAARVVAGGAAYAIERVRIGGGGPAAALLVRPLAAEGPTFLQTAAGASGPGNAAAPQVAALLAAAAPTILPPPLATVPRASPAHDGASAMAQATPQAADTPGLYAGLMAHLREQTGGPVVVLHADTEAPLAPAVLRAADAVVVAHAAPPPAGTEDAPRALLHFVADPSAAVASAWLRAARGSGYWLVQPPERPAGVLRAWLTAALAHRLPVAPRWAVAPTGRFTFTLADPGAEVVLWQSGAPEAEPPATRDASGWRAIPLLAQAPGHYTGTVQPADGADRLYFIVATWHTRDGAPLTLTTPLFRRAPAR